MSLNILSAKCGLGKSYALVKSIYESDKTNHIIAAPSVQIANQIKLEVRKVAEDLKVSELPVTVINSSTVGKNVTGQLKEALLAPSVTKSIIVITHATYHNISKSFLKGFVVHVDEIPNQWIERMSVVYDWNHSHDQYFITNQDGTVSLTDEAKQDNDTLENSNLFKLIAMVKEGSANVHSLGKSQVGDKTYHQYLYVITPDYFTTETTLYTADDHVSDIVTILKGKMQVNVTTLHNPSRVHHYDTSEIDFVYFMEDRKNSINVAKTMPAEYDAGLNELMKHMEDRKCLILMNKDVEKRLEVKDNFITIAHNVHGMNEYNRLTKLIVQSATNRSIDEEKCLIEYYKLSEEQIFNSRIANVHQAIMRLAIRRQDFNQKFGERITVGFVDLQTAYACKSLYFPNASLTKLGNYKFHRAGAGRPNGTTKVDKLSQADVNKGKAIRKKVKEGYTGYTKQDLLVINMNPKTNDLMKTELWKQLSPSGLKK